MNHLDFGIYPIEAKDFQWFNECRNLVRNYLHNNTYFSLDQTSSYLSNNLDNYWIVSLGHIRIGYFRTAINLKSQEIMIGLDIHPDYQGKKYAKQLYKKFIEMMFLKYQIRYFFLRVIKTNTRAMNLYLTYGFKVVEETDIDFKMVYKYDKP